MADLRLGPVIEDLHSRLNADGIELWLCHVRPAVRDLLDRAGVLTAIGANGIYANLVDAIVAYGLRAPGAEARAAVLTDLLDYVRVRRRRTKPDDPSIEMLEGLERRLAVELARVETPAP